MWPDWSRRKLLSRSGPILGVALTGCIADSEPSDSSSSDAPDDTDNTSLTEWERSTDCDGDPDGMYDSVIKVQETVTDLGEEYAPIRFSELSTGEREILDSVTDDGGYGTCDPSDSFDRFLDRVRSRDEQQRNVERSHVYLERDGTYYRLYVEFGDVVLAY